MAGDVIVITGPTAVGKTELAIKLAERLHAEIISADSRQIYHYMDVGTAKPTPAQRAAAPHHVLDVAYPDQPYSVATFQRDGERALNAIRSRAVSALIVGGSPHYIQALVDRLRPPPLHPALRRWIDRFDREHPGRLDAWLAQVDPASHSAIPRGNRRRRRRAAEVVLLTGRRFSDVGRLRGDPIPATWIGLHRPRAPLYERVDRRLRAMLHAGWLEEVRVLLKMGFSPDLPSMSATGYADLARALGGEVRLEEALERVRFATHAFIRRQETWMRRESRIRWIDADHVSASEAVERILSMLHNGP